MALGATVSVGNFEFVKFDTSLQMPFDASSKTALEQTYKETIEWVKTKLKEEISKVRTESKFFS